MLPILPALLLMLLQGPANIERMASEGQLPAALNAIHRQMECSHRGFEQPAEQVVLASLLAVSQDREMSQALFRLLSIPPQQEVASGANEPLELVGEAPPCPPRIDFDQRHFVDSQRSRDGPTLIV
jgi:hypothetical protein